MSRPEITDNTIRNIKRQARKLSRTNAGLSYMQHLDAIARDMTGVRHFHEAKRLAASASTTASTLVVSPMMMYLQACQESYFEI